MPTDASVDVCYYAGSSADISSAEKFLEEQGAMKFPTVTMEERSLAHLGNAVVSLFISLYSMFCLVVLG
jgi:hypothetical protein